MVRFGVTLAFFTLFASLLLSAPGLVFAQAQSDEAGLESAFDAVSRQLRESSEVQAHYRVCPADIAKTARPLWRNLWRGADIGFDACGKDIEDCYSQCMEWRNHAACFSLARVFEEAKPVVSPHDAQMLFAQACATGSRGGCTNRASGIRNGRYQGDPMLDTAPDELDICYHRTFDNSCGDGDAWGCAMLGQTYQLGEGVERSADAARRFYLRSCEINEKFPACDFARRRMTELE